MGLDEMKDKVAGLVSQHDDKVDQGIEKAGDLVDERFGGQHADKVDQVQDRLQGMTGEGDTVQ